MAVHAAALIMLAMIFVAHQSQPQRLVISSAVSDEPLSEEFAAVEIEPPAVPQVETVAFVEPAATDVAGVDVEIPPLGDVGAVDEPPLVDLGSLLAGGPADGNLLAAVGSGGDSDGAARAAKAAAPTFFGRAGAGHRVCFLCDNSNSHTEGGFETVLAELVRAVDAMPPDQSFHVLFFSDTCYPMFHPHGIDSLVPATPENKLKLRTWLASVEMCGGGQGIHAATDLAAQLQADVVYFLSDGDHADSVVRRLIAADFDAATVHTFGMQSLVFNRRNVGADIQRLQEERNRNLIEIAVAHGGGFQPVVVSPEAVISSRARPIRKNRSKGPVWGLSLPD